MHISANAAIRDGLYVVLTRGTARLKHCFPVIVLVAQALTSLAIAQTPPSISVQPNDETTSVSMTAAFSIVAAGTPAPAFQWQLSTDNGNTWVNVTDSNIYSGSTSQTLMILSASQSMNLGLYRCRVTNTAGTAVSQPAWLYVTAIPSLRFTALSVRAPTGPGDNVLFVGVAVGSVSNGQSKQVVVRGVGPGLAGQGVNQYFQDPMVWVYSNQSVIAFDDDWSASLATVFAGLGINNLAVGSKDAAVLVNLGDGGFSAEIGNTNGTSGVALAEIYETDKTSSARMYGLSARALVGAGEQTVIAAFIIGGGPGDRSKNTTVLPSIPVLIRGLGPALAGTLGSECLSDPQIQVLQGQNVLAQNDDWSATPDMLAAFASVGLSPMKTDSKDAAVIINLPPGTFTVLLNGVNGAKGIGMIEIYQLPQVISVVSTAQ